MAYVLQDPNGDLYLESALPNSPHLPPIHLTIAGALPSELIPYLDSENPVPEELLKAGEMKFRKDFNGYSGFGRTEREADIALAYACAFLPLAHERQEDSEGDAYFGNLPGWDGKEEENYAALGNR